MNKIEQVFKTLVTFHQIPVGWDHGILRLMEPSLCTKFACHSSFSFVRSSDKFQQSHFDSDQSSHCNQLKASPSETSLADCEPSERCWGSEMEKTSHTGCENHVNISGCRFHVPGLPVVSEIGGRGLLENGFWLLHQVFFASYLWWWFQPGIRVNDLPQRCAACRVTPYEGENHTYILGCPQFPVIVANEGL